MIFAQNLQAMKKMNLLLLLLAISVYSCNRDDDNDNGTPTGTGKFEFVGNGTLYQLNTNVQMHENATTAGNVLNVAATNTTMAAVGGIDNYTGPRTYDFSEDNSNYIAFSMSGRTYYLTGGNALAPASHGVLTVTAETTTGNFRNTKGTFSGVAYASATDSMVITNGVFIDSDF